MKISEFQKTAGAMANKALEKGEKSGGLCGRFGTYEGALTAIQDLFMTNDAEQYGSIKETLDKTKKLYDNDEPLRAAGFLRGELIALSTFGAFAPGVIVPHIEQKIIGEIVSQVLVIDSDKNSQFGLYEGALNIIKDFVVADNPLIKNSLAANLEMAEKLYDNDEQTRANGILKGEIISLNTYAAMNTADYIYAKKRMEDDINTKKQ